MEARTRPGFPCDARIVLQLGRMVPRKGIDTVIRGVAALLHDYAISADLIIVGGDSDEPDPQATPEIGRLMEIARTEGAAERVHFVGRKGCAEIKYYLLQRRRCIYSSPHRGTSLSALPLSRRWHAARR
jgi:D-inositol-3-phosphate glycosyltransferase